MSEKGFRGGDCNSCGNNAWGDQGEGTSGIGTTSTGSNQEGGGGGYGPGTSGEAGGGGGYGTSGTGGNSENPSSGGNSIGSSDLSKIYFGGGAGAGGDNNARTPSPQNVNGGGIVIIYSNEILNGRIIAKGETGIYGSSGINGGVSGSGAGGTIWLNAISQTLTDVNASGGPAVSGYSTDVGGAGGDGRIRFDYLSLTGNSTPTAGYTNTTFPSSMSLISTSTTAIPFYSLTSQSLTCGIMFEGDLCNLSWNINTTGFLNIIYDLNINITSNQSQVPDNDSINSQVKITNDPIITINSPINNSIYNKGDILYANLTSDDPLTYAGYYINDNISNIIDLTNISSTQWEGLLNTSQGNYILHLYIILQVRTIQVIHYITPL